MPHSSYIICTSPRSGSTLLSNGLRKTNVAGRPTEYFNPSIQDEVRCGRALGVSLDQEYMEKVINVSTTANGVFGTKIHAFQTWFLMEKIGQHRAVHFNSLREALETELPSVRYITLRREDNKIRQAISYYRALATNEWWRYEGTQPPAADATIEYYALGIQKCLAHIQRSDAYWESFFLAHDISPLRLTFEELIADYSGTIRKTLLYLGLPTDVSVAPPTTVKISDNRTLEWEKKFIETEKYSDMPIPETAGIFGAPF